MRHTKLTRDGTEFMIDTKIQSISTMFVGKILKSDPIANKYTVQSVLIPTSPDGGEVDPQIIALCPASILKTGTFYIRAKYEIGDMVYVGVSKESIDESLISAEARINRTSYRQNFSTVNGVILGGLLSDEEDPLDSDNQDDLVFINRINGDTIIMEANGGISIKSESGIEIGGDMNIIGDVNIVGDLTITGNIDSDGDMSSGGSISASGDVASGGTVTASVDVVSGTISLKTHVHSNGNNGYPTGVPIG